MLRCYEHIVYWLADQKRVKGVNTRLHVYTIEMVKKLSNMFNRATSAWKEMTRFRNINPRFISVDKVVDDPTKTHLVRDGL